MLFATVSNLMNSCNFTNKAYTAKVEIPKLCHFGRCVARAGEAILFKKFCASHRAVVFI